MTPVHQTSSAPSAHVSPELKVLLQDSEQGNSFFVRQVLNRMKDPFDVHRVHNDFSISQALLK
jgi:hypothetical protein